MTAETPVCRVQEGHVYIWNELTTYLLFDIAYQVQNCANHYKLSTVLRLRIMGSQVSQLVDQEKTSWVCEHKLDCEPQLSERYSKLVNNFQSDLALCYQKQSSFGYEYQHWFITDRAWIIEFGSGAGDFKNNAVVVHAIEKPNYTIAEEFKNSNEVRARMRQVCGARNYSLALRNCEHVARYIQAGVWVSFQMAKDTGILFNIFKNYLGAHSKLINTFPGELIPSDASKEVIYNGVRTPFQA